MKQLLLLSILLFPFLKGNAQNGRWMYIVNMKGVTLMVDTLTNDIKQLDSYDGHNNVVLIWVKTIENKLNKKGSFIESTVSRFAMDTTLNQLEVTSGAIYHNNIPVQPKKNNYIPWQDIIPESESNILIIYCQALHNQQLMHKFILNAKSHDLKPPLSKKKGKSS